MAFKLAEAVVDIRANIKDLETKLGVAKGKIQAFVASVKAMAVPLEGLIGYGVADSLWKSAKAAGDLNETLSKTQVIFGDSTAAVSKFADEMYEAYGSSRTEILDAASDLGLVAKAIGLAKPEAAAFSIQLAKLADDAASFYNVGLGDALDRIKAALRGESDPIEKFGVMLNEAAVKQEALRLGLVQGKGELTDAMKIQARYSLIVKGLADATGDHARTQDSFNNQLKEFNGRLDQLKITLGQGILPLFNNMLQAINPMVEGFARMAAEAGKLKDALSLPADSILGKMGISPLIGSALSGALGPIGSLGGGGLGKAALGIAGKTPAPAAPSAAPGAGAANPFGAAAAKAAATREANDVAYLKAAGYGHGVIPTKGQDGKLTERVGPGYENIAPEARMKLEGMLSALKEKGLTAIEGFNVVKEGLVSTAIKGVNMLAEKPRGGGGVSDVDSFQRDLQAGALNAEKAAEETAKNTGTMATLLGEIKDIWSRGKLAVEGTLK